MKLKDYKRKLNTNISSSLETANEADVQCFFNNSQSSTQLWVCLCTHSTSIRHRPFSLY